MSARQKVVQQNAKQIREWILNRRGCAVWRAVDFSGRSWTTPVLGPDNMPVQKPHWAADSKPEKILTHLEDFEVVTYKEAKRFHVAVRIGDQGLRAKLTDGSTRKVRAAVERAGEDATYEFDYETQEAIILVPDHTVGLEAYSE